RASGSGFAVGLDGGGGSGSDLLRSGLGGRGGLGRGGHGRLIDRRRLGGTLARRAAGARRDATAPSRRGRLRRGVRGGTVRAGRSGIGQRELRSRAARLALL